MERKIKLLIAILSMSMFILSLMTLNDVVLFSGLIIGAIITAIVPATIMNFIEFKKIDSYEKQFPNFLKDLSEAQQSDLTLIQAIKIAGKSNYGSFTKEVKKLNNQLSWNISLIDALENFRKRLRKSKIINRSIIIIQEAQRSGGNVKEIMNTLSTNIEEIKELNAEKTSLMRQQVMMVYAIYFIFLGIIIALIKFLIPMLSIEFGGEGMIGGMGILQTISLNPCQLCAPEDIGCAVCGFYSVLTQVFGFESFETVAAYYKSLFFMMIVVQAIFSGLVSGQIGSDSIIAGTKHSLVMLSGGIAIFLLVNWVGFI